MLYNNNRIIFLLLFIQIFLLYHINSLPSTRTSPFDISSTTIVSDSAYFFANSSSYGVELWAIRTVFNTTVFDISPGIPSSDLSYPTPYDLIDSLMFYKDLELWRCDGVNTIMAVPNLLSNDLQPSLMVGVGTRELAIWRNMAGKNQLWLTNGITPSYALLTDVPNVGQLYSFTLKNMEPWVVWSAKKRIHGNTRIPSGFLLSFFEAPSSFSTPKNLLFINDTIHSNSDRLYFITRYEDTSDHIYFIDTFVDDPPVYVISFPINNTIISMISQSQKYSPRCLLLLTDNGDVFKINTLTNTSNILTNINNYIPENFDINNSTIYKAPDGGVLIILANTLLRIRDDGLTMTLTSYLAPDTFAISSQFVFYVDYNTEIIWSFDPNSMLLEPIFIDFPYNSKPKTFTYWPYYDSILIAAQSENSQNDATDVLMLYDISKKTSTFILSFMYECSQGTFCSPLTCPIPNIKNSHFYYPISKPIQSPTITNPYCSRTYGETCIGSCNTGYTSSLSLTDPDNYPPNNNQVVSGTCNFDYSWFYNGTCIDITPPDIICTPDIVIISKNDYQNVTFVPPFGNDTVDGYIYIPYNISIFPHNDSLTFSSLIPHTSNNWIDIDYPTIYLPVNTTTNFIYYFKDSNNNTNDCSFSISIIPKPIVYCGEFPDLPNVDLSLCIDNFFGGNCTVTCSSGYTGEPELSCTASGQWNIIDDCVPIPSSTGPSGPFIPANPISVSIILNLLPDNVNTTIINKVLDAIITVTNSIFQKDRFSFIVAEPYNNDKAYFKFKIDAGYEKTPLQLMQLLKTQWETSNSLIKKHSIKNLIDFNSPNNFLHIIWEECASLDNIVVEFCPEIDKPNYAMFVLIFFGFLIIDAYM